MKNVLILSCSTGQGHNSCAQAIREYFETKNVKCEIMESLAFISKRFSDFISWGHSFMYRHIPGMFSWGYSYSLEHPKIFHEHSEVYSCLEKGVPQLYQYIVENQFDAVICTHVFPAIMMTSLQKRYSITVQTSYIATDYTCHPGLDRCSIQYYFVPTAEMKEVLLQYGISEEQVVLSAIPVRKQFCNKEEHSKELLHIDPTYRHLLVMCGSMGCGPISAVLKKIANELPEKTAVTVLCGTNRWLYKRLKNRYRKCENIYIQGFTNKISLYMDSADLYLTKPGGISVSEAAAKNLPMVLVNAVAGCERYNMDYFTKMGAGVTADSPKELAKAALSILCSPDETKKMESAFPEFVKEDGAEVIYETLSEGITA